MKPLETPPIPTRTELKIMLVLLNQPEGIYAAQIDELTGGAIPAKSAHSLFQRLGAKGYIAAGDGTRPIYTLTRPGECIARGFADAFAVMPKKKRG